MGMNSHNGHHCGSGRPTSIDSIGMALDICTAVCCDIKNQPHVDSESKMHSCEHQSAMCERLLLHQ